MSIDPSHQLVILARLSEFSQFKGATVANERDPWNYMRRKLHETEPAMVGLKDNLYRLTAKRLLEELKKGMDAERYADYRSLFERLLTPGDFADLAFHLDPAAPPAGQLEWVKGMLIDVRPTNLFIEERKPAGQRPASWEKLVNELYGRLGLDLLDRVITHKPRTAKRKAVILRKVRANTAEYCSVVRIPTQANDTFTPFMLPRIEGLIAANLRFLDKYR